MTDEEVAAIKAMMGAYFKQENTPTRDQDKTPMGVPVYLYVANDLVGQALPALLVDQEAWRSVGRAVKKLEFNLPADAMGRHYCPWCHWSEEGNLDEHEADCPLKIIPALLGG